MPALSVRQYRSSDKPAILALLRQSFHGSPSQEVAYRWDESGAGAFFAWKHEDNPLGPSLGWVAVDGERIVGYRVFMRYEFVDNGAVVQAVRAVDTATDLDYRGRGVFRLLTLHAIETLASRGIDFIFNTPNDMSMPGYLKMGWQVIDRLRTYILATSPLSIPHLSTAFLSRGGGQRVDEALPTTTEVFADRHRLESLLAHQCGQPGLVPRRSVESLLWRYGRDAFGYWALCAPEGLESGVAIFRLVERGHTRSAILADVITPAGDASAEVRLVSQVLRRCRAHLAVRAGNRNPWGFRAVVIPGSASAVVCRSLQGRELPTVRSWGLSLDDLEI